MNDQDEITAKIVVLGESAVGKSCIVLRFVHNEFVPQECTIGAAFITATVQVSESTVKYEIWDTAGQERYRSLAPMYYRGAVAAIVVYDITSKDSFRRARSWINELRSNGDAQVLTLVGNKCDLEEQRCVRYNEGQQLAEEEKVDSFFETSALTGQNIQEVFSSIASRIVTGGLGSLKQQRKPTGIPGASGKRKKKNKKCCEH